MRVKQAEYIEDYKIKVFFSDGAVKVIDFALFLQSAQHVFLPLRDVDYFKMFQVDDITLSWPNGADFDPELLHEMGHLVKGKPVKRVVRRRSLKATRTGKHAIKIAKNKTIR